MRILVTGATGFIGSHLIPFLEKCGHEVHGISRRKTTKKNFFSIKLSNFSQLNDFLKNQKYDRVIHLAATIKEVEPFEMIKNNCYNTLNLLECCRKNNLNQLVFASTHNVYGNSIYLPIDEKHTLSPRSNYGISKLITMKEM